ncbi:hypothetical protein Tco_0615390 [Tanacetum coccineum]
MIESPRFITSRFWDWNKDNRNRGLKVLVKVWVDRSFGRKGQVVCLLKRLITRLSRVEDSAVTHLGLHYEDANVVSPLRCNSFGSLLTKRFPRKSFSKKHRRHKTRLMFPKQGRKKAKGRTSSDQREISSVDVCLKFKIDQQMETVKCSILSERRGTRDKTALKREDSNMKVDDDDIPQAVKKFKYKEKPCSTTDLRHSRNSTLQLKESIKENQDDDYLRHIKSRKRIKGRDAIRGNENARYKEKDGRSQEKEVSNKIFSKMIHWTLRKENGELKYCAYDNSQMRTRKLIMKFLNHDVSIFDWLTEYLLRTKPQLMNAKRA